MHLAPPPSPGSRIQELGDTLVVRFRPRRSWGDIVFLTFWLTGWTFGGIAAVYGLTQAGWGGRASRRSRSLGSSSVASSCL